MVRDNEVKSYKWVNLKDSPPKNAVLYVLDPISRTVEVFITDKLGTPTPVKGVSINISDYVSNSSGNGIIIQNNKLFVKKYISGDNFIEIVENNNNYIVRLKDNSFELIDNKQNNLTIDGSGTKYPTVDAVNAKFLEIEELIDTSVGDKTFEYEQVIPASTWVINHTLNKRPSVIVIDTAGTVMEGQITILSLDTIVIEFNFPFSGTAILN